VATKDPEVVGEGDDGFFGLLLDIRVRGLERYEFGYGWYVRVGFRSWEGAQ
jgi:hypothetical protein